MTPNRLSPQQLDILRHTLGSSHPSSPLGWRNYYCAPVDDSQLLALVESGYMEAGNKINGGRDQYFFCTDLGIAAAKEGYKPPVAHERSIHSSAGTSKANLGPNGGAAHVKG